MIKSYRLALIGLLVSYSGLHAMEKNIDEAIYSTSEKDQVINQALLGHCVTIMKQAPGEIIRIIDFFGLDPNEVTKNIFLNQYKTSILGHWIGHLYKKMEKRIYESVVDVDDNSSIRYEAFNWSASGMIWYGVSACETKKIKPIEEDDKLILEKLFKHKANLYSLIKTPCEKQTNPHATNYITPKKILSLLTENNKFYKKIRLKTIDGRVYHSTLATGFMLPFEEALKEKKETFVNTIEELSKANK